MLIQKKYEKVIDNIFFIFSYKLIKLFSVFYKKVIMMKKLFLLWTVAVSMFLVKSTLAMDEENTYVAQLRLDNKGVPIDSHPDWHWRAWTHPDHPDYIRLSRTDTSHPGYEKAARTDPTHPGYKKHLEQKARLILDSKSHRHSL